MVLPAQCAHLLGETATVGAVGEHGTQSAGPRGPHVVAGRQERLGPAAVVAVGRVHLHAPNAPARVAEHLARAPVHAFMRVGPALLVQARH